MTLLQSGIRFSGYHRRLVDDGILTANQMQAAIEGAKKTRTKMVPYLVETLNIRPFSIAQIIAQEFGEPFFDLDAFNAELAPKDSVEKAIINKHLVIPLSFTDNTLHVATSDPTDMDGLEAVRLNSKLKVVPIVVEHDKLLKVIEKSFGESTNFDFGEEELDVDIVDEDAQQKDGQDNEPSTDDSPIVKYINKLLVDAIRMGASDLHFEPYEKSYRVRYRIDGVLRHIANPPIQMANRLASRLKVMSQMDISEKRVPQDGRIKLKVSKHKAFDFRVNSLPTLFGEKLVLRILDSSSAMLGIDSLGYEPNQKALFLDALKKTGGASKGFFAD